MSKIVRFIIYILLIFVFFLILYMFNIDNFLLSIILAFLIGAISETIIYIHNKKTITNNIKYKKCKYCQSEIDINALTCPICKKNQSNANNPLLLIPILIIVLFFGWCLFSNNAPDEAKKLFCSFGIRKGTYCQIESGKYEIDINVIN